MLPGASTFPATHPVHHATSLVPAAQQPPASDFGAGALARSLVESGGRRGTCVLHGLIGASTGGKSRAEDEVTVSIRSQSRGPYPT